MRSTVEAIAGQAVLATLALEVGCIQAQVVGCTRVRVVVCMQGLVEEYILGLLQMTDTKGHGNLVLQELKAANGRAKTVLNENVRFVLPRAP
jgi:hypothetical protein